jgi:hypothetical protein
MQRHDDSDDIATQEWTPVPAQTRVRIATSAAPGAATPGTAESDWWAAHPEPPSQRDDETLPLPRPED